MIGRRRGGIMRRPWPEVPCWALDLEMSGLDPHSDRIVAVGMVPVRERAIRLGESYESLVGADGPLGTAGIPAHHILPDRLIGAPPLADVVAEIDRRLAGTVMVVHAGQIDLPFLQRAFRQTARRWPEPPVIDTLLLLRRQYRHRLVGQQVETAVPAGLGAARELVGLPPHEAHDARADAVATAELLLVLAHRLGACSVSDLVGRR